MELSKETMQALDQFDWTAISVPRSAVEANPVVANQLASGKATELISFEVNIPGIPEPVEKTVQLVSRKMKNKAGEWVLDPKIGVREMNEGYELTPENLRVIFDNNYSTRLDPEKDKAIINHLLETRSYTNKETGERATQYVCNICPIPLEVTYNSGETQKFYVGLDNRSLRPVAISETALKARLLDKDGHCRITHELFGKSIKMDDTMAQAIAQGQISAAFGKGSVNGEEFATAISFNVARGEIQEDHTKKGMEIRQAGYNHLKKTQSQEMKNNQVQKTAQKKSVKKSNAPKL